MAGDPPEGKLAALDAVIGVHGWWSDDQGLEPCVGGPAAGIARAAFGAAEALLAPPTPPGAIVLVGVAPEGDASFTAVPGEALASRGTFDAFEAAAVRKPETKH